MKEMLNAIELNHVTKEFKTTAVLQDITLALEAGRTYGIVGRNGSGKSVLLKLICGLMLPTEGSVTVGGKLLKDGCFAGRCGDSAG